ncbi:MAG: hypothetical protein ABI678_17250 [Kofleriaceae bacterium]
MTPRVVLCCALVISAPARADDLWVTPVEQLDLHVAAAHEADRPYSTVARPRDVTGEVALSCDGTEGRPCGDGAGAYAELDAGAGYADLLVAGARLRFRGGSERYGGAADPVRDLGLGAAGLDVDRLHVTARRAGFELELARDAFALGPGAHTNAGWSTNAAPLDFARASYASARGGLLYLVGRLRAPQALHGNLVTIARGELVAGPVVVGAIQLLQLEGNGAPHLGVWDFVTEHVTRGNPSAGPDDTSNRRVGVDASSRIAAFGGARLYYELMFEDWRRQIVDAIRYDADHVIGGEFADGLVIEWQKTGFRSQEHAVRTTGFTNAGRLTGSPLGPDAQALYVARRFATITPWLEVARFASDTYSYAAGQPIVRISDGRAEFRYRAGAFATRTLDPHFHLEVAARVEQIRDFAYIRGDVRTNLGADLALVWRP